MLSPQWGLEHLAFEEFIIKMKTAGFDGVDTWLPQPAEERRNFIRLLQQYHLPIVCHQHQANGNNIGQFCRSFEYHLNLCMECSPLLINSHSGRDYFSIDDQLQVIDVAEEFAVKNNIRVIHETHRGRLLYSPYNARELFKLRPGINITADFSHWCCVTESFLENCADVIDDAIARTQHIHARVGYPQGPQVPDPRVDEWQHATGIFVDWWMRVLTHQKLTGQETFTITTEFGPPPYMQTSPINGLPVANQFEINCFIKNLIKKSLLFN